MTRPLFCQHCRCAVPAPAPMPRLGTFWLCGLCWQASAKAPCPEFQHAYRGSVDDHGSQVWCCERCGSRLQHQVVGTAG